MPKGVKREKNNNYYCNLNYFHEKNINIQKYSPCGCALNSKQQEDSHFNNKHFEKIHLKKKMYLI